MFNLFRSRDKLVRYMLGALLILVSLSMLTYLIPSYNTGADASDVVVAQVGKETITLPDVQRAVQNTARGRQIPPEVLPTFIPQIVEGMITERALAYQAKRMGLSVSDTDIAVAIRSLIPSLFQDGKFVGTDAYSMMLSQQNLTIPEFESELARQLLVNKLRNIAIEGTVITPREIEQEFKRRNEKVKIEYVQLNADKLKSEVQVSAEDMRAYFNANKASFQVPEKRNLAILVVDQAKLEQSLTPTDAQLQRLYNDQKDRFRTPERIRVRHILLKTTGKSPQEEAAIKAKAEDLLKQIKGGADFAELAKKNSEDTGSAVNGGELPDWVTRGQTVPEFEKEAFSLKPKEISGLVKTVYGYHILQVLDKEQPRLRPFEEVKAQLAADYKKTAVNDAMSQIAEKAQNTLSKDPQHPEKVAADLNLQLVRAEKVSPGDPIPEIGVAKEFEDAYSTLKKGEVSQAVLVPGNKLAVAEATDVIPSHPAAFEDVQGQIRDLLAKQKADKLVVDRADQLAKKAAALNGDLRKAAASFGLQVKVSDLFTRQGAVEGLGSANYVSDAFAKPVGSIFGPQSTPDGRVIGKVIEHAAPDMNELGAQRVAIRDELKSRKSRDRNTLFEDGLRQVLTQEGKIKIHQEVVNRLITSYRG